jgi:hypothetical protein
MAVGGASGPAKGHPHESAVTQITGAFASPWHDARVKPHPDRSTAMFTRSHLVSIAHSPEIALTMSFVGILFAYISAASFWA